MGATNDTSTSGFVTPEDNEVLPRFTDLEEIPSAGFNVIVRAKRYGRWWILKGLKEEVREENLYKELLKKEFDILISMQHPGVVAGMGLEQVEGLGLCIVMEWVDGMSLKEWLRTPHRKVDRLRVALQIMDALEYIHGKQTAHRDLKPSNILVTHNGQQVKLIDFGLSDTDSYAVFKQPAGTIGYVSPEQSSGGKSDVRNDIYSLGCVLDDLQLGIRYRGIVIKCKRESGRRYHHVGEVRRALLSRSRLKWYVGGGTAVVVLAGVVGGVGLDRRNDMPRSIPAVASKTDSAMARKVDTLKAEMKLVTDEIQATKTKEEKMTDAIAEGKQRLDRIMGKSGWQKIDDIVVFGELMQRVANEMNAVWENYPQELDSTYTQVDREQIRQVLATHYTELYKPMYNKYVRIQTDYAQRMKDSLEQSNVLQILYQDLVGDFHFDN